MPQRLPVPNRLRRQANRVTSGYAATYAETVYQTMNPGQVDKLDQLVGGLEGKNVIDVGAGPGQYAAELASRGAHVTWFDLSPEYQQLAEAHAAERGVELSYRLGNMDELSGSYDLIFFSYSWHYSSDDRQFARTCVHSLAPGGLLYIVMTSEQWFFDQLSGRRLPHLALYHLNDKLGIKIGHPYSSAATVEERLWKAGATSIHRTLNGHTVTLAVRRDT